MTASDWFSLGLCAGLALAYVAVRLGRRSKEQQR